MPGTGTGGPEDGILQMTKQMFQCPLGLEFLLVETVVKSPYKWFQCPLGLELLLISFNGVVSNVGFQCPHGLELLPQECPIF